MGMLIRWTNFETLFGEPDAPENTAPVVTSHGDGVTGVCFACTDATPVSPEDDWPTCYTQEGTPFTVQSFALCDACASAVGMLPNGATVVLDDRAAWPLP